MNLSLSASATATDCNPRRKETSFPESPPLGSSLLWPFRRLAIMPRIKEPWLRSSATRFGKEALTESWRASPAKTPSTIGAINLFAAATPSRRLAKSQMLSNSTRSGLALGMKGSAIIRNIPMGPMIRERANASGCVFISRSRLCNRYLRAAASFACTFSCKIPFCSNNLLNSGSLSRYPVGPASISQPSRFTVRALPPTFELASSTRISNPSAALLLYRAAS